MIVTYGFGKCTLLLVFAHNKIKQYNYGPYYQDVFSFFAFIVILCLSTELPTQNELIVLITARRHALNVVFYNQVHYEGITIVRDQSPHCSWPD